MSRECFEMVARAEWPEIDLSLAPDGDYRATKTRDWHMGWKLARGEMVRYLSSTDSDIVSWGATERVGA